MYAKISTDPQAIAKRVARNNKRFQKLSPEKQRVAIARDALSQLKASHLRAIAGDYMQPDYTGVETTVLGVSCGVCVLGVEATVLGVSCRVCALGAMFCGLANNTENQRPQYSGRLIRNKLIPYFSERQLTEIESAYEMRTMYFWEADRDAGDRARHHFPTGTKPAARLQAILGNIIRNKGTFVPRKVKEV